MAADAQSFTLGSLQLGLVEQFKLDVVVDAGDKFTLVNKGNLRLYPPLSNGCTGSSSVSVVGYIVDNFSDLEDEDEDEEGELPYGIEDEDEEEESDDNPEAAAARVHIQPATDSRLKARVTDGSDARVPEEPRR